MLSEAMENWLPIKHPQGLEFALSYPRPFSFFFFLTSKPKKL